MNCFFKIRFICFVCLITFGCGLRGICQAGNNEYAINDTLKKLIRVAFNNNPAKLFVHYDKNVYLPNEAIWFTAYRPADEGLPGGPDVFALALVKNSDRGIVAHKKFVVTGIASSGTMLVPDSVTAGDYTLIAYTNRFVKGRPDELFLQHVTIKRLDPQTQTIKPMATQAIKPGAAAIDIKFYPEGGELVAGLPGIVGWEAKDKTDAPLAVKGLLYQDGQFADTIMTSASGMGKFFIKPKTGSKYEVRVISNSESAPVALPAVNDQGVALTLPAGIVRDTLVLKVASTAGNVHIVIQNARKIFYAIANTDPGAGKLYKIALDSLPRGLAEITVFNQAMRPCAERVFFAHYDKAPSLSIKPDQAIYGKRKKVTLTLKFHSAISAQGTVSVACVRTNRIDRKNFNDIEIFGYIERSINSLPVKINNSNPSREATNYLEDILLIKGWRRYSMTGNLSDTSTQLGGFVTMYGKPTKKPVMLVLFKDTGTMPVVTDSKGRFTIANIDLVANNPRRLSLMTAGQATYYTHINWTDPYDKINLTMAHALNIDSVAPFSNDLSIYNQPALDNNILLKQVIIRGKKDDEFEMPIGYVTNKCGDYVCVAGILNCMRAGHKINTRVPIVGHKYQLQTGGFEIYQGCLIENKSTIHPEGIAFKKEFYPYSDADITLSEPLYENTLYWKNQLNIEKNKEIKLSFYTGDIKAGFSIIVRGVADNEVVFAEQHFEVE